VHTVNKGIVNNAMSTNPLMSDRDNGGAEKFSKFFDFHNVQFSATVVHNGIL
jgi:uncharacterized protein YyaL (SSP411 family)